MQMSLGACSVPDEGFSRNVSCALILISTFLFKPKGVNRLAKLGRGYIYLGNTGLGFNKLHYLGTVRRYLRGYQKPGICIFVYNYVIIICTTDKTYTIRYGRVQNALSA